MSSGLFLFFSFLCFNYASSSRICWRLAVLVDAVVVVAAESLKLPGIATGWAAGRRSGASDSMATDFCISSGAGACR